MSKPWRYIDEENVSASYGLAVDEYLTQNHTHKSEFEATLRLYNYKNYSALCGRFQDIQAEIDIEACNANAFQFNRRLTGGGAIIMGQQQLGICFASTTEAFEFQHIRELYKEMAKPVINALKELGINAAFRAKNDLEVDGKKIAGLGIYIDEKGGFHFHCSLLLDLNIEDMLKVLNIPIQKYSDRRLVQAIEQRITTINRESQSDLMIQQLKKIIANSFVSYFGKELVPNPISLEELEGIRAIETNRYATEDWIFQRSRQKDMTGMSLLKTPSGMLRTYVGLKGETIKSVLITGDFMDADEGLKFLEAELKWSPLDKERIDTAVYKVFGEDNEGFDPASISKAIWTASQRALAANRYTYKGSCYYPKEETTEIVDKQ